jgi:type III secretion system-like peptide-binding chaperone
VSEWGSFLGGLTETLRDLADGDFLVVFRQADPHVFVQFAGGEHELHAEAAGHSGLAAAGWVPPPGNDPPNWSFSLPLPALTVEYAALAERCVVALRDVHGLPGPDGLVYKAWGDGELTLAWLGLPAAHG